MIFPDIFFVNRDPGLQFSDVKDLGEIQIGSPQWGHQIQVD